jgi:hypothetical protein
MLVPQRVVFETRQTLDLVSVPRTSVALLTSLSWISR